MTLKPDFQKIADTHPDAAELVHAFQDLLQEPIPPVEPPDQDGFQRSVDRYFQFLWDHYDEAQSEDPYDYKYEDWRDAS